MGECITEKKTKKRILIATVAAIATAVVSSAAVFCSIVGNEVFKGGAQMTTNEITALNRAEIPSLIEPELFYEKYEIQQVEIPSRLGDHSIPADYILPVGADKGRSTAILVHGLGGNRLSVYPIAELFLSLGYNVLLYDQRSSGENTAPYNTFGYLESYDLLDYVDYVDALLAPESRLVVWGTSYGGATTATAIGRDTARKIDYAILDCPVGNARAMIEGGIREASEETGIPYGLMMAMGEATFRRKLGFSFDDMDIAGFAAQSDVPLLVFAS